MTNVTMVGQFWDTGFEGASTFVDCWPCEHCGTVVSASLCSDECNEILAFCDDCSEKCSECRGDCERTEKGCPYGAGYTFVRPDTKRLFRLSSGEHGWWDRLTNPK